MTMTERNQNPSYGDGPNKNDEHGRKRTSLRSAEADLKVVVGKDLGGDTQNENMKVYWHFSQTLAAQSGYVDTLLSTSIGTNIDSNSSMDHKEIFIDYVLPEQWDRMMRFITNPLALKSITIDDAMELAPIYDKYEFLLGLQICDEVLSEKALIRSNSDNDLSTVEQCVQAIVLAHDVNLRKTFHWGREWLKDIFSVALDADSVAKFPLTAIQISLLVPTFIRDGELQSFSTASGNDRAINANMIAEYLDGSAEELSFNLIGVINDHFRPDDLVDLTSPLFPGFLLARMEISHISRLSQKGQNRGSIQVAMYNTHHAAGYYNLNRNTGNYSRQDGEDLYELHRCPRERHWQLCRNNEILFSCRNSRFSPFPPLQGSEWVGVDETNSERITALKFYPRFGD